MKTFGITPSILRESAGFTQISEKDLLKTFKPRHRNEVKKLWSALQENYKPDYHMQLVRDNKGRLTASATASNGVVFTLSKKCFVRPIAFMRRLSSAFNDLFSDLRLETIRKNDATSFVETLSNSQ